jgi:PleD family two-component response regulator
VPLQNTVAETLVDVADVELYRAKRDGRNRVAGGPAQRGSMTEGSARTP